MEPVIVDTELKVPTKVFLSNEPAPWAIPLPPSNGPFTNPSRGLSIKSKIPVPR